MTSWVSCGGCAGVLWGVIMLYLSFLNKARCDGVISWMCGMRWHHISDVWGLSGDGGQVNGMRPGWEILDCCGLGTAVL